MPAGDDMTSVCVCACFFSALAMLTYLVASFMGLLHKHPPLVVQLHGHAAAAVGVLPHPAEELLQLPAQRGVGVSARLGVAGARHEPLCRGRRPGGSGERRSDSVKCLNHLNSLVFFILNRTIHLF